MISILTKRQLCLDDIDADSAVMLVSSGSGTMLTSAFSAAKYGGRERSTKEPQSQHRSTQSSIHDASQGSIASSSRQTLNLSAVEIQRLLLFLKSSRAIPKLSVADITGSVDAQGERIPPPVRTGRLRLPSSTSRSSNTPTTAACCMIGSLPFERCEIVATVVKKYIAYMNIRRRVTTREAIAGGFIDRKGKGKATQQELDAEIEVQKETISLIFYEMDDGTGDAITCMVHPGKMYNLGVQQQFTACFPSAQSTPSTDSSSIDPPCASASASTSDGKQEQSDPRLWIYRYKEPPPPVSVHVPRPVTTNPVPIYEDGTVLRITGNIVRNPKVWEERQIDAKTVTVIANDQARYVEWHHTVAVRNAKRDLYHKSTAVAQLLDLDGSTEAQRMALDDRTSSKPSSSDSSASQITTNDKTTIVDSSTASGLTDMSQVDGSYSYTLDSRSGSKKRGKLPSLRTLAESKRNIDKPIFYLYVHQHVRALTTSTSKASNRTASDSTAARFVLSELQSDPKLDWLASKCSKLEAVQAAQAVSLKHISGHRPSHSQVGARAAANSLILPSSSPVHQSQRRESQDRQKVSIKPEELSLYKKRLWNWIIKRLIEDGIVMVWPAEAIKSTKGESTPRAGMYKLECVCAGEEADVLQAATMTTPTKSRLGSAVSALAALTPKKENVLPGFIAAGSILKNSSATRQAGRSVLTAMSCTCSLRAPRSGTTVYPSAGEETYSLVMPELLRDHLEPIYRRITERQQEPCGVDAAWKALRNDDMWRFVSREMVADTLQII